MNILIYDVYLRRALFAHICHLLSILYILAGTLQFWITLHIILKPTNSLNFCVATLIICYVTEVDYIYREGSDNIP